MIASCDVTDNLENNYFNDEINLTEVVGMAVDENSYYIYDYNNCAIMYEEIIGGGSDFRLCSIHAEDFHQFSIFSTQLLEHSVFRAWSRSMHEKMRQDPSVGCLVNTLTFIEYFGFTQEEMQYVLDNSGRSMFWHNLDILFSRDIELIEWYYSIENEEAIMHRSSESWRLYIENRLKAAQEAVWANVSANSRHFHDIWSFVYSWRTGQREIILEWMEPLVEAGLYYQVNMVDWVRSSGISFETVNNHMMNNNVQLFVHFNLDVIFSDDDELIRAYYSKENEILHNSIVQAAFEAFAAQYGTPDTSWMIDVPVDR